MRHATMLLPHAVFLVLIVVGLWTQETSVKTSLLLAIILIAGIVVGNGLGFAWGISTSVAVILDVILILKIFGGDIRIH